MNLKHKMVMMVLKTSLTSLILLSAFIFYILNTDYIRLVNYQYSEAMEIAGGQLDLLMDKCKNNYQDIIGEDKNIDIETLFSKIDKSTIEKIFDKKDIYANGEVRIFDDNGNCLYIREQKINNKVTSIAANLQQMHYSQNVYNGKLSIEFTVDKVAVMENIYVLRGVMILIILCSITVMIVMASAFSEKITSPIYAMMKEMEKIETGDFKVDIPVTSTDEIGVLSNRFNRMSRQLKKYINRSYVAEINEKEAELIALKSQIHPHFLYNTLEVIRMTALDESDEKTAKMIEALSEQMRYVIGDARDMVPLQMEIEVLHKYIYLINCRYDGKVVFEVEANNLMNVMIPKLILQPIIENAFFHGLRPNYGEGTIKLIAEEFDERIDITIMDNGVGMKKEEQNQLEELLASDRPGNKSEYSWRSIGLKNVHDRLYYIYGEKYGITIISHENMGTSICVSVPKHMEEVKCGL